MTAGRCKWEGCGAPCGRSHCDPHRALFNAAEKERGVGRRTWNDTRCQNCFQSGHDESKCLWKPSIFANAETPAQAAARIVR